MSGISPTLPSTKHGRMFVLMDDWSYLNPILYDFDMVNKELIKVAGAESAGPGHRDTSGETFGI